MQWAADLALTAVPTLTRSPTGTTETVGTIPIRAALRVSQRIARVRGHSSGRVPIRPRRSRALRQKQHSRNAGVVLAHADSCAGGLLAKVPASAVGIDFARLSEHARRVEHANESKNNGVAN